MREGTILWAKRGRDQTVSWRPSGGPPIDQASLAGPPFERAGTGASSGSAAGMSGSRRAAGARR
jgi:hypothetical protein